MPEQEKNTDRYKRRRAHMRRIRRLRQRRQIIMKACVALCIIAAVAAGAVLIVASLVGGDADEARAVPTVTVSSSFISPTIASTKDKTAIPQDVPLLVNKDNAVPADYTTRFVTLSDGMQISDSCYDDLQAMMDSCRASGLSPVICSAYRTAEAQNSLLNETIGEYLSEGYSYDQAQQKAGESVAQPGHSEHQLGLAVDIVDENYQLLASSQEDTPVQKWLMQNCYDYGFILRYPPQKSDITGIAYEPWHYRYVGKSAAAEIKRLGNTTLEEYVDALITSDQ